MSAFFHKGTASFDGGFSGKQNKKAFLISSSSSNRSSINNK